MNTTVSQIEEQIEASDIRLGLHNGGIGGAYMSSNVAACIDFTTGCATKADNIQDAKETAEKIVLKAEEAEKNKDTLDHCADEAMDDMREDRKELIESFRYQNGMYYIDGAVFSEEALDDTKKSIEDDPQAFGKKHGLNEEQVDVAYMYIAALQNATTPEEKAAVDARFKASHPEVRDAVKKAATEEQSKLDHTNAKVHNRAKDLRDQLNGHLPDNAERLSQVDDVAIVDEAIKTHEEIEAGLNIAEQTVGSDEEYGDMFSMEDTSSMASSMASFSENLDPLNATQSLASSFTPAADTLDHPDSVASVHGMHNTKSFDFA